MSYAKMVAEYINAAMNAGMDYETANAVRRDAQRIHTISEQECNGTLYRAEAGPNGCAENDHRGRPLIADAVYQVSNINGPGPLRYWRTADRETPARARIEAAAASVGGVAEFQGDPRGWPVVIVLADGRRLSPPIRC